MIRRLVVVGACMVPLLAAAPRPGTTRAEPLATSLPAPTNVPTSTGKTAEITDLWSTSDGVRSSTVYAGHRADLTIAYRFGDTIPSGARWATFAVVAHGATVIRARTLLGDSRSGSVVYHLTQDLPVGLLRFTGTLSVGGISATAHRQIDSLDPNTFLSKGSLPGAQVKSRTSHVESNAHVQGEPFVFSPGGSTPAQPGRQTGTFQSVRLSWPKADPGEVAVQARLTSMFGSAKLALAAFNERVKEYRLAAACRSGCTVAVRPRPGDSGLGKERSAFLLEPGLDVHVAESLFVRGHLAGEVWTYYVGKPSASVAKRLTVAIAAGARAVDAEAKRQQSP